jgi:uncharacterized membrane protein
MITSPWRVRTNDPNGARSRVPRRAGVWAAAAIAACAVLLWVWGLSGAQTDAGYMAWNLPLAMVPLAFGWMLLAAARTRTTGSVLVVGGALWILFLPNAPYLATDVVHIHDFGTSAPVLVILAALAVTGALTFFAATVAVRDAARLRLGPNVDRWLIPACIAGASLGIYLGRFLRWNSWDVITHPAARAAQLGTVFHDAGSTALALAFILGCAGALALIYAVLTRAAADT